MSARQRVEIVLSKDPQSTWAAGKLPSEAKSSCRMVGFPGFPRLGLSLND